MRFNQGLKSREIAGEKIVILPAKEGANTCIMSMNSVGEQLLEEFRDKEFEQEDMVNYILELYDATQETVRADIAAWVDKLVNAGAILK